MRPEIHPEYHEVTAVCSCGAEYKVRSTAEQLRLEVCSSCHPFYTGKQHFVDSAGMVEKFQRRYGKFEAPDRKASKAAEVAAKAGRRGGGAVAPAPVESAEAPAPKAAAKKEPAKKAMTKKATTKKAAPKKKTAEPTAEA